MSSTSTLMRQTKSQLVDIILRKDAVEKDLKGDIDSYRNQINNLSIEIKKKDESIETLEKELENHNNICDDLTTEKSQMEECCLEYRSKCNVHRILNVILLIALGIAIIL